ncbi:bacterial proteasome activator family protein [Enemella evansiae]|uniref:bacterial proteasome activator family protein n=1 Tax=Enemella evansiae TaxID=2016499 RepID=UPI000B969E35|nr:bacterial proteasome activator family protein [Enemella evansiae]OYO01888.1 peptidyl-prolyl cis-trans isomerase [Enemella evansiae]
MSEQRPEQANQGSEQGERGRVVAGQTDDGRVYVVSPQAMAVESAEPDQDRESVTDMVPQPDKVMRIATMTQKLLDEIKAAPLDDPSRKRISEAYGTSIEELKSGLDPKLAAELERITEPFAEGSTPSDAELRIAQAQLVGWLEGLFQGIQTAIFAQQMAARAQLEQMRRALPPGAGPMPGQPGQPGQPGHDPNQPGSGGSGMYL